MTGLQRRTPLAPGKPLARKTLLKTTVPLQRGPGPARTPARSKPAPRADRPTKTAVTALQARDRGTCVPQVACTGATTGLVPHHRRNRGMGGSTLPDRHALSGILSACRECNSALEDQACAAFYANGWKVRHGAASPADIPVLYPDGRWYLLNDSGTLTEVTP